MEYAYIRVSKPTQDPERQVRRISREYPDAVIVKEAYTGSTLERPKWQRLYHKVKEGDTIIFDSVSRMSRDADEGFAAYEELFKRGVKLVFLEEPYINTDVFEQTLKRKIPMTGGTVDIILDAVNKYLMELAKEQIKIAFEQAEKELNDIHTRTKQGMETARLNGKQIGRAEGQKVVTKKSIEAKKIMIRYAKSLGRGGLLSDTLVMQLLDGKGIKISKPTYYKYKQEIINDAKSEFEDVKE